MMRAYIYLLFCLLINSQSNNKMSDGTECKLTILKQLTSGKLFSDTLNLSGRYLNELGNYNDCVKERTDKMKYELKVYRSNKSPEQFDMTFVIGICTFEVCEDDSLTAFDTFYI